MSEPKVTPESLRESVGDDYCGPARARTLILAAADRIEELEAMTIATVSGRSVALEDAMAKLTAERAKVVTLEAEREVVAEARAEVVTVEEQLMAERAKLSEIEKVVERAGYGDLEIEAEGGGRAPMPLHATVGVLAADFGDACTELEQERSERAHAEALAARLREAIEQACRMLPGETDVWSVLDLAARRDAPK
jgi:hypothetical protein